MAFELVYVCDALNCVHEERVDDEHSIPMPKGWSKLNISDRRAWHLCPEHTRRWDDGRGERLELRAR